MRTAAWIFGYGSLIWRPGFPYVERQPGYIVGFIRRFWQSSTDHRGTPEAPGRVVTLLYEPGAACWGAAYRIADEHRDQVLGELDHREKQGYERIETTVHMRHGTTRALVYIATTDNPHFIGAEAIESTAHVVRSAHGPSGSNREYVLRLARALEDMGVVDPHVSELARLVASE